MPKVSIIVPNRDHAPYLEARLKSIFDQSFRDWELVFLDDASKDGSVQVFQRYANDPRVKAPLVSATPSGSPYAQWRKGITASTGQYIWIAESDDVADPAFLAECVDALDRHPRAGLAFSSSRTINDTGAVTGTLTADLPGGISSGPALCGREFLFSNIMPNASAVVFRRSLYEGLRPLPAHDTFRLSHDWFLWVRMLFNADLFYIPRPLNLFRRHSASTSDVLGKTEEGVYEKAVIISTIASRINIDSATLKRAMAYFCDEWAMRILKYGRIIDRNRAIYRLANTCCPDTAGMLWAACGKFYRGKFAQKRAMVTSHLGGKKAGEKK